MAPRHRKDTSKSLLNLNYLCALLLLGDLPKAKLVYESKEDTIKMVNFGFVTLSSSSLKRLNLFARPPTNSSKKYFFKSG
jgi:hypothetical protein